MHRWSDALRHPNFEDRVCLTAPCQTDGGRRLFRFRTNVEIGKGHRIGMTCVTVTTAVVVAIGSRVPRDMKIPGRELDGIHFAPRLPA